MADNSSAPARTSHTLTQPSASQDASREPRALKVTWLQLKGRCQLELGLKEGSCRGSYVPVHVTVESLRTQRRTRIPERHSLVAGASCKDVAVRHPAHLVHAIHVPPESLLAAPCCHVPQPGTVVQRARCLPVHQGQISLRRLTGPWNTKSSGVARTRKSPAE